MLVVLAGGVGAARFLQGLAKIVDPKELVVITNTGDDLELYGLHISPDVDIITYTMAGIVDEEKGWGIANDTFNFLGMAERYGLPTWFKIGDFDLATHIFRTMIMRSGKSLTEATRSICDHLKLQCKILPMTDAKVACLIRTGAEEIHFEEYYVKRGFQDRVEEIIYQGFDKADPAPGVIDSVMEADGIIVAPSNPLVSIGTILRIRGVRHALQQTKARVLAISPIVGGAAIKGPADKMLAASGVEVSPFGVATLYKDFLDVMVIDLVDQGLREMIHRLGVEVVVANTIMKKLDDKIALAEVALRGVTSD